MIDFVRVCFIDCSVQKLCTFIMRGQGACQATNFLALRRMKKSKVIKAVGRRELKSRKIAMSGRLWTRIFRRKNPNFGKKIILCGSFVIRVSSHPGGPEAFRM